MFELSVACKYLIPRRRQLSVSIISLISVLVIALVVWLIVVFFSVTDGLEKNWVNKLTALTAPVRVTPTDTYYNSYYYLADSLSDSSNYSLKTIREKNQAQKTDPYDPSFDQEIPSFWARPDLNPDGSVKDLVKGVYQSLSELKGVPGIRGEDFELTASHIRLLLRRDAPVLHGHNIYGGSTQSTLSYPTFLGNFEASNDHLDKILLPVTPEDLSNYFSLIGIQEGSSDEELNQKIFFSPEIFQKRLKDFLQSVTITSLKTRSYGWTIPQNLLPETGTWKVCALLKDQIVKRIIVPVDLHQIGSLLKNLEDQGMDVVIGNLSLNTRELVLNNGSTLQMNKHLPITLEGGSILQAELVESSIDHARKLSDVKFSIQAPIQGTILKGIIPYQGLSINAASFSSNATSPFWVHQSQEGYLLPKDQEVGDGIILPKSFKEAGVLLGDRGKLSYFAPTASILQEHDLPVYVAGFYDPGIIPIGGKFILANQQVASLIRSSHQQDDKSALTNGINVRFNKIDQAEQVKNELQQALKEKGINRYWTVETYREYEFTKTIMQELQSQKNIFLLIAVVIIVVACSNIISMLIILVNDKKTEIGILRSMGATTKSIALIFGLAGGVIGIFGSLLGIAAALLTLQNMGILISLLSRLQGYELFNASFYGTVLPHELSYEALLFVLGATVIISLLAGIVPAVKACLLRPSHILRASGG